MQVPPAFRRADDAALLTGLVDPTTGPDPAAVDQRTVLDGRRLAYLVAHGRADLFAVPRRIGPEPHGRGHFLGTFGQGTVVPSSTVLGAWQLALAPLPGTVILPLNTERLRGIGYGGVGDLAEPPDLLVPAPRAVSVLVAALARGLDAALFTLAEALRSGAPPPHAMAVESGQIVSLEAGAAVTSDGGVSWLRVAGGHARRNDEDAAVFGGAEPALLAGRDWIVVDGPATAESIRTSDLLVTGHLPAALDQHLVLTLRGIEGVIGRIAAPDDPAARATEIR
ncbi:MAG TPA: hypothetical protein VFX16_05345 [Pseudonocardiaceae bacterium]|nr:hypothetical protein [Pseudonocardiaceae bacterium]